MYQKKCAHTKISVHTDYKKLEGTLIQSLFKTMPCPLKCQHKNHTGVLVSDSKHEYIVDQRSMC